jgi:uncharacterized protein HemX
MSNISHIPKEFSFIYADELYDEVKRLERQLAEARDMLLQVQDHMHQLSSHTSDGWAGASADNVFNMIEDKLEEIGDE